MGITEISDSLEKGYFTSEQLVQMYLERIEEYDHLFNSINQLNNNAINDAKKLDKITYDDIIKNGLKVMDTSSCALCKQNNIPIVVFDFDKQDAITDILNGKDLGTYIN